MQLSDMRQSSQFKIQQREKEAQDLRQAVFSLAVSADTQILSVIWLMRKLSTTLSLFFIYITAAEVKYSHRTDVFFKLCLPRWLLCVGLRLPLAFGTGCCWRERRHFYGAHSPDRAEALWTERAHQRTGKDGHRWSRAAAGQDPEGNCWTEEERGRTWPTVPHWWPRPVPPGDSFRLVLRTVTQ